MFIRSDQGDVRVSLDSAPLFGPWATYSGGDRTSPGSKTRPGSMGDEVEVGAPSTRNDATLTIQWTESVLAKFKRVDSRVGVGRIKVSINWLDAEKKPIPGAIFTRTGVLKSCTDPNYDHNGNAVGFFQITVGLDEVGA